MRHTCGKQGMSRTLLFEKFCGKACLEDTNMEAEQQWKLGDGTSAYVSMTGFCNTMMRNILQPSD